MFNKEGFLYKFFKQVFTSGDSQRPRFERTETWSTPCVCGYLVYYYPNGTLLEQSGKPDTTKARILTLRCNACYRQADYAFPGKFQVHFKESNPK